MLLIVNNLLNIDQNKEIINISKRAFLPYKEISAIEINKKLYFKVEDKLIEEINISKRTPILSFGSYNLALYLKNSGFLFGHNLDNLNLEVQIKEWGKNNFLNSDMVLFDNKNVSFFEGKMFFRSINDSKSFQAGIYDYKTLSNIKSQEKLIMSNVKKINAEYRFVIINGEIADNSSYKINGIPNINIKAENDFVEFIKEILKKWIPTQNFVIDVADINGEPKIIEVNNIHCSRFYNCSIYKILDLFIRDI